MRAGTSLCEWARQPIRKPLPARSMTVDSYRLASLVHLAKDGGGIPVIVRLDDW